VGRILLVGANGQLGTDLRRTLPAAALIPLTRADLDVTDHGAVERALATHAPAWVINTTAYHRVDDIETKDAALAFTVNEVAVGHLAQACTHRGARLLHLSTDYVFGGGFPGNPPRPYTEEAPPAPLSVYGASKLAGERRVRDTGPDHVVVRSSGLYGVAGSAGKGGNFVETMRRLALQGNDIQVVEDQILGPTYTADLAEAIAALVAVRPPGGIYHLTNAGACSWFQFASRIFKLCGLSANLRPTTSAAYKAKAPAPRPAYSVLANTRAAALGLRPLRPWSEALDAYLRAKGHVAD
jgi:dTDP-4-dehydrorhamnose reductase